MKIIESVIVPDTDRSQVVTIDEVIKALERAPSKDEVFQAIQNLRQDRLKDVLDQSVKEAKLDRERAVRDFLIDRRRGAHTQTAYRLALQKLFSYVDLMGLSLLSFNRADANRFRKRWRRGQQPTGRVSSSLTPNG